MSSPPGPKKPGYFATVPPQEILPITNGRFESSVKGIYVIADVTGLPLVKVAANQGVDVIAKMEAVSGGFAGYHFGGTRGPVPPRVRGGGPNDAPREIRFKKERW